MPAASDALDVIDDDLWRGWSHGRGHPLFVALGDITDPFGSARLLITGVPALRRLAVVRRYPIRGA
ncbi:MAG TPA: hypothetical protein VFR67_04090 [Pilimelia sp.]|nr:hypothetical protein [Pilimelia sp.]